MIIHQANILNYGLTTTINVNQYDSGRVIKLALDTDVSDYIVKYLIKLKSGNAVTSYCTVEQGNIVAFILPENATQEEALLGAQIVCYDQEDSQYEDWIKFKNLMLNGDTPVLINFEEGQSIYKSVEEEKLFKRTSTFPFNINVHKAVVQNGNQYEELMEDIRTTVEDLKNTQSKLDTAVNEYTSKINELNQSIQSANGAAQSANAAATRADTSSDACDTAASNANSKATLANNAATNANAKATEAQTQANAAKTAAEKADQATADARKAIDDLDITGIRENMEAIENSFDGINTNIETLNTWKTNAENGQLNILTKVEDSGDENE